MGISGSDHYPHSGFFHHKRQHQRTEQHAVGRGFTDCKEYADGEIYCQFYDRNGWPAPAAAPDREVHGRRCKPRLVPAGNGQAEQESCRLGRSGFGKGYTCCVERNPSPPAKGMACHQFGICNKQYPVRKDKRRPHGKCALRSEFPVFWNIFGLGRIRHLL